MIKSIEIEISEAVVFQISSPPMCMVLRKDDKEECEAWLIGNLRQDLTPKKGSQLPTNGDILCYFVFLNSRNMKKKINKIK